MGTRCYIAKEIDNQQYKSIYCQLDGYPEMVGKLLLKHYNTSEKLDSLLALGDIYVLGEKITPDPGRPHNANESFQKGVTVAYGRDFDGPDFPAEIRTLDEMIDSDDFIEFVYVFTANQEWEFSPLLDYDSELTEALTKLYEKYVPAPVREYIDEADAPAPTAPKPRRAPKPAVPKPTEEAEVVQ